MLAQAAHQKLKNAESSMQFMREQHAKTLEGLHEEIHKLQKKNARLTFELTMKGSLDAPAGKTDCSECKHLEDSLMTSKAEILKLRSALASSEDKIHLLDHQIRETNVKFAEEVQQRDERLSSQSNDLETKANTIAMLTQQLYNTKIRLRNEIQAKNAIAAAAVSHSTPGGVCVCPHCYVHSNQAAFTGDRSLTVKEGRESGHTTAATVVARPLVSGIQRRHFRNASSPVSHNGSGIPGYSTDHQHMGNKTGNHGRRLPTPPLTPRPPSTDSPAPSTIRRASNPSRRPSPSPKSKKDHVTSGGSSLLMMSNLVQEESRERSSCDVQASSASLSTANVSGERKELDPVQVHRQGAMPSELRQLLESRENERDGELAQLVSSRPAPLPPITGSIDETTPTQSDVIHYGPATASKDSSTFHELLPSRLKGRPHISPQQHRHIILAKAQGLSSAPSTMRVLRYSPQQQNLRGEGSGSGQIESKDVDNERRETAEGTLLVKETIDRNDSALQQELHYQR